MCSADEHEDCNEFPNNGDVVTSQVVILVQMRVCS